jgi:hypothetical protein
VRRTSTPIAYVVVGATPGTSDRAIAVIAGCDHKTVAAHRNPSSGQFPAITGDLPADDPWEVRNLPF